MDSPAGNTKLYNHKRKVRLTALAMMPRGK